MRSQLPVDHAAQTIASLDQLPPPPGVSTQEMLVELRQIVGARPEAVTPRQRQLIAWVRRNADRSPTLDAEHLYDQVAATGEGESIFRSGTDALEAFGYGGLVDALDAWATSRFVGLGCPWAIRRPEAGETVLDLGCGSGVDRTIAERLVGPTGRAIGIDLRGQLLGRAAAGSRAPHVRASAFVLPFPARTVSTTVANGLPPVMSLRTIDDVLGEVARVSRPSAWVQTVVLASGDDVDLDDIDDLLLVNAVRTGKPLCAQFRSAFVRAGLVDVSCTVLPSPFVEGHRPGPVSSVLIMGALP